MHGHAEILTGGPTIMDYRPAIEICMLIKSPYLFFVVVVVVNYSQGNLAMLIHFMFQVK